MTGETDNQAPRFSVSWPVAMIVLGIACIGASFLPVGAMVARAQWTPEDSAAHDRVSQEYKQSNYQSAARRGLTQEEWDAQRDKMRRHMLALEARLEQAKSQPKRWSRYLLGIGAGLTAAGFLANGRI